MKVLFRAERLPVLQNRTYSSAAAALASPVGNVVLVQSGSGLVHNVAFEPSLLEYNEHYQNEQGLSPAFHSHLEAVAALLGRFKARPVLEIGCGKGGFLRLLQSLGFDARGVDPAYEGDDPTVIRQPFTRALGVRGDLVVLRHVLEHLVNPVDFLSELAEANGGGTIYIEVPCFDWILENRAWFDIYYEHVNYFRLADLMAMFGTVHAAGRLFGDQYIYVMADLGTLRAPASTAPISMPPDFMAGVADAAAQASRHRSALWGAASKGVIFSTHLLRSGAKLQAAIDINPAKQGRFLPQTGLPVLSPGQAMEELEEGDQVFVMNRAYFEEISAHGRFKYICV